ATLFPYTTLFRSILLERRIDDHVDARELELIADARLLREALLFGGIRGQVHADVLVEYFRLLLFGKLPARLTLDRLNVEIELRLRDRLAVHGGDGRACGCRQRGFALAAAGEQQKRSEDRQGQDTSGHGRLWMM